MLKIGQFNTLTVTRDTEHGLYLGDAEGNEVLLPGRCITDEMTVGSTVEVFLYTDSSNRPIATTERPFAVVGQFAFLQVADVNATGAFLDWGIDKDLLVPFSNQKSRMYRGGVYPVYIYLDDATGRVVATAKLDKYLGNVFPDYEPGRRVKLLVMEHNEAGYRVIVDDRHWGFVYNSDLNKPLVLETTCEGYVKKVRADGKIDVAVGAVAAERVGKLGHVIAKALEVDGGFIALSDGSSPEEIRAKFDCSKKDFKKAIGILYKEGRIVIEDDGIRLKIK